jgi:hypothetical protein
MRVEMGAGAACGVGGAWEKRARIIEALASLPTYCGARELHMFVRGLVSPPEPGQAQERREASRTEGKSTRTRNSYFSPPQQTRVLISLAKLDMC